MFFYRKSYLHSMALAALLLTGVATCAASPPVITSTATVAVLPVMGAAPMTIDEAVKMALQQSETIKRAQLDIRIAEEQLTIAKTTRLPSVNLELQSGINKLGVDFNGRGVTLNEVANNFIAIATQPIWPPVLWRAPRKAAEAGLGGSKENLNRSRQQLAFQVRQAASQYLSAVQMDKVAASNVTVAEKQLQLANIRVKAGTAAKIDEYQAEANLASAQIAKMTTQNNIIIAQAALAVQIGLPANSDIQVLPEEKWPSLPPDEATLTQFALSHRPDVKSLQFTHDALNANVDLLQMQKRPIVTAVAQFTRVFAQLGKGQNNFSIGFDAKFNAYNGGKLNASIASTKLQGDEIDSSIKQVKLGVGLEVRQAYLNLQVAINQQEVADKQVAAASEAARIAQIRYDAGEGIFLEKQQADLNKLQADTALVNARYQAQIARAQLYLALGIIFPDEEAKF